MLHRPFDPARYRFMADFSDAELRRLDLTLMLVFEEAMVVTAQPTPGRKTLLHQQVMKRMQYVPRSNNIH